MDGINVKDQVRIIVGPLIEAQIRVQVRNRVMREVLQQVDGVWSQVWPIARSVTLQNKQQVTF